MEDSWYSLAAMPGWLYVDTGASGGEAATILQVDIHCLDISYRYRYPYCRWRSLKGLCP